MKLYTTRIDLVLTSVGTPDSLVYLDKQPITFNRVVAGPTTYQFTNELSAGTHVLEIEHKNKPPHDADTALIVTSIAFNDIASDKFAWRGVYTPAYPEPWASEQSDLAPELPANNYLGWNGVWRLEFTVPIFTWIHQVEDLGWIYD